jgi:hypothetical protein
VREKSVQNRCNLFTVRAGPSNELKAILKTELLMRDDQLRDTRTNGYVVARNLRRAKNAEHIRLNSC